MTKQRAWIGRSEGAEIDFAIETETGEMILGGGGIIRSSSKILFVEVAVRPEGTMTMQHAWIGRSEGAEIDFAIESETGEIRFFGGGGFYN